MKHKGVILTLKHLLALLVLTMIRSEYIAAQYVKVFSEDSVQVNLPLSVTSDIRADQSKAEETITNWFVSQGYFSVEVSKNSPDRYTVAQGCRYEFGRVKITPDKFSNYAGDFNGVFSDQKVESGIQELLKLLEVEGYLFAEVLIEQITPDPSTCTVDLHLNIESGETMYSGEMLFPGADLNSRAYLGRISGAEDSVLITSTYLDELRSNLLQSELFTEVGTPEVYEKEEGSPVIVIPVEERSLNQFDGLLGYVPDPSGNGQIVGDFELSLWNVLNQGNGMDLMFERLRPENTRLHVGVRQDWIGSIPLGIGFNFNLFQNDTTYQSRNLRLNAWYLMGRGMRVTGAIGQTGSTSGTDLNRQIEPDGRKRYAELGFRYSSLDNPEVPRSGVKVSAGFGVANKSVDIDSVNAFSQQYLNASVSYFMPVLKKSVMAVNGNAYFLNSEQVTDSDLLRFGGARSLRGYSEEQFRGSQVIWGDVEYRYLLDRSSYLFAFGGIGYYQRPKLLTEPNADFETSDVLYSTGFGISYKIRIGRLKLTYAISPQERLGNGKVHVGIVTRL